ncbi:hypothetical protein G6F24_017108 [Rhizopus arrhizus]|nr:hypothetical protein G6F24_017108 [Rhizopus arrhizus]
MLPAFAISAPATSMLPPPRSSIDCPASTCTTALLPILTSPPSVLRCERSSTLAPCRWVTDPLPGSKAYSGAVQASRPSPAVAASAAAWRTRNVGARTSSRVPSATSSPAWPLMSY